MKVLLALLFVVATAVTAKKQPRIHYGRIISQAEAETTYNFVVNIISCGDEGCGTCTGALIAPDKVLTAAHCLCNAKRVMVYGKTGVYRQGDLRQASVMKKYPDYKCNVKAFDTDFAFLKLSFAMDDITPIPYRCGKQTPVGTAINIIGYGKDEKGERGTLRIGDQKTIPCWNSPESFICAPVTGRPGHHRIDNGDSGGPVVVRTSNGFELIAVQIGRKNLPKEPYPIYAQIYNSVSHFCDWIKQQ